MEIAMRSLCCASCGVLFSIPEEIAKRREEDHRGFFCPNGHSNHYPEASREDVLKEKVKKLESEISSLSMALDKEKNKKNKTAKKKGAENK